MKSNKKHTNQPKSADVSLIIQKRSFNDKTEMDDFRSDHFGEEEEETQGKTVNQNQIEDWPKLNLTFASQK